MADVNRPNLERGRALQLGVLGQIAAHAIQTDPRRNFVTTGVVCEWQEFKRFLVSSHSGRPMRLTRSANRGSERRLSHLGSILRPCAIANARSSYAFSSQAKAWSFSPRPA